MLTFQLSNQADPESMLRAIDPETGELVAWLGGLQQFDGENWMPTTYFAGPWASQDTDEGVCEFPSLDLAKSWVIQTMGLGR